MAKRKQSGFSADFQEQANILTKDSPLILLGSVMSRTVMRGKGEKGAWEFYKVEVCIRGCNGRTASATVNDPAGIPPLGEFIALPVYVGSNGFLREAKQIDSATF